MPASGRYRRPRVSTREGVSRPEGGRRGWGGVRLRSRERPEGASGSTEDAAPSEARRPSSGGAVRPGWDSKGQSRGRRRRRKHRRERVKRATEERGSRRLRRLVITKGAERLSNDSERTASSRLGLWRCSPSFSGQSRIAERLGLWRHSPSIHRWPFINNRLRIWRRSVHWFALCFISNRPV